MDWGQIASLTESWSISRWRPGVRVLDLFEMARKQPLVWWPGSRARTHALVFWRGSRTHARLLLAALSWCLVVAGVQASSVGGDIGNAVREFQERIELRIRERYNPLSDPEPPPQRTHEESIEPWELVSV